MTYGSYKKRQIEQQQADSLVPKGEGRMTANEPDFPDIGRDLLSITHTNTLTYAQLRELCETPVANAQGVYPPPQKEKEAYPQAWAHFIKNIPKMPWYIKVVTEQRRRVTASLIIDLMRGYTSPLGWFHYRPASTEITSDPTEDVDSWM